MKKLLCTLAVLTCAINLTACGSSSDSSTSSSTVTTAFTTTTVPATTSVNSTTVKTIASTTTAVTTESTTAEEKSTVPNSSSDYVKIIGKDLEITDITKMAAEMIGAEEGTSFMYKGNKFEIYRFKADDPKIEQARSGSLTYNIEGFGEFTSNSSVNNDYVMIYDTPDESVIQAFNNK